MTGVQTCALPICFTGLGSGTTDYQVIVVGEDGVGGSCLGVIGITTVSDPAPFDITVTVTDESCPDATDGGATVSVTGEIGRAHV